MKIELVDYTNFTETKTAKRADRTLNYRPTNKEEASAMMEGFAAFLGSEWKVYFAARNPYGHGWGHVRFTVYAVKFL
jgi:hypothetical protein